jgi:hypothetical protein
VRALVTLDTIVFLCGIPPISFRAAFGTRFCSFVHHLAYLVHAQRSVFHVFHLKHSPLLLFRIKRLMRCAWSIKSSDDFVSFQRSGPYRRTVCRSGNRDLPILRDLACNGRRIGYIVIVNASRKRTVLLLCQC